MGRVVDRPCNDRSDDAAPCLYEAHRAADFGEVLSPEKLSHRRPVYRKGGFYYAKKRDEQEDAPFCFYIHEHENGAHG